MFPASLNGHNHRGRGPLQPRWLQAANSATKQQLYRYPAGCGELEFVDPFRPGFPPLLVYAPAARR